MEKIYNEIINETLYSETLNNGLEVLFMPKKGFLNKYAILGVDFGSNDLEFIPINESEKFRVNEGIAHFLEHKMFEQPDDSNAFDEFSKLGVSANAFTNFNMTAYLFSGTDNFYPALKHLISYVQSPHYTNENVEKEKGIIAQEIKMYQDDPDWNVYMNCIKAMYKNHYVNIDIAGTVESIYKITPEELYKCYNTFYNPANMKLFVIGDLDKDELLKAVKEVNDLSISFDANIKRFIPEEPDEIKSKVIKDSFVVSMPIFYIGYKDTKKIECPNEKLKNEIVTDILFDIIFSESGDLYNDLYNKGLIFGGISGGYLSQKDYSYAVASANSKEPERLKEIVDRYIEDLRVMKISEKDFELNKKKKIGGIIKSFDSIKFIANNFLTYRFRNINFLDYLEVLKNIELEDINNRLEEFFLEKYSVISIIEPKDV